MERVLVPEKEGGNLRRSNFIRVRKTEVILEQYKELDVQKDELREAAMVDLTPLLIHFAGTLNPKGER
ncbi:hypothetical protein ACTWQL_20455 [Pseudalkalibacillus sp. R45]|uniref:hypothetical protein n=1 Tax=Pseudalkalibacillus sp. R45 TaxID=3457433 RepID=UPI003FCC4731